MYFFHKALISLHGQTWTFFNLKLCCKLFFFFPDLCKLLKMTMLKLRVIKIKYERAIYGIKCCCFKKLWQHYVKKHA